MFAINKHPLTLYEIMPSVRSVLIVRQFLFEGSEDLLVVPVNVVVWDMTSCSVV
jgi:hypothetical protein